MEIQFAVSLRLLSAILFYFACRGLVHGLNSEVERVIEAKRLENIQLGLFFKSHYLGKHILKTYPQRIMDFTKMMKSKYGEMDD